MKAFLLILAATTFLSLGLYITSVSSEKTGPVTLEPLVLETNHLETLHPHQHDTGDSILMNSHHEYLNTETYEFVEDTWITGMEFTLHNAPATVLHHAIVYDLTRSNPICPQQPYEIGALGEDTLHKPELFFPEPYGIFIPAGTRIKGNVMIHNPLPPVGRGGVYEDVFVTYTFHRQTTKQTNRSVNVTTYNLHLDDTPCNGAVFTVPSSTPEFIMRASDNPADPGRLIFETDGEIIYSGGHIHGWEGGRELNAYLNGDLMEHFETARSPEDKYVWNTSHDFSYIPVTAGDELTVEAIYENPTPQPLTGAMGIYTIYFAPKQ